MTYGQVYIFGILFVMAKIAEVMDRTNDIHEIFLNVDLIGLNDGLGEECSEENKQLPDFLPEEQGVW